MKPLVAVACALALAGVVGCKKDPRIAGGSLVCSQSCPDGFRCVEGGCIVNSPPIVAPFELLTAKVGYGFSVTAVATDADPEDRANITYTWTQIAGPPLLIESLPQAQLSLTPTLLGLYTFEVFAHDGIDAGSAQSLSVNVVNERPVVVFEPLHRLPLGVPFESPLPQGTDADGHAVTYTWTQTSGPEVALTVDADGGFTLTPTALGVVELRLVASDGFEDSDPVAVTLVVQPGPSAIYVTAGGVTGTACGAHDQPCGAIAEALVLARAQTPPAPVLVAASPVPYAECLALGDGDALYGGFDAATWQFDAGLIAQTRVLCPGPTSTEACLDPQQQGSCSDTGCSGVDCAPLCHHCVNGSATLDNLVLGRTLTPSSAPTQLLQGTLLVQNGGTALTSVTIETADCGPGCTVLGLLAVDADLALTNTTVRAVGAGFAPVDSFTGLQIYGGSLTVTRDPELPGDSLVLLNAPANVEAQGINSSFAALDIDGLSIEGGFGPSLSGVAISGGTSAVRDLSVELTGFGSLVMSGVQVYGCSDTDAQMGDCDQDAGTTVDSPGTLVMEQSTIRLLAGSSGAGFRPCLGQGVVVVDSTGSQVRDNLIEIGPYFSLALAAVEVRDTSAAPAVSNVLENNVVRVGSSEVDELCQFVGTDLAIAGNGLVGIGLFGAKGSSVLSNSVSVGLNEEVSVGLLAGEGLAQVRIEGNTLVIEDPGSVVRAKVALGLLAGTSTPGALGEPSLLLRNRVAIGRGVIDATAVALFDDVGTSSPPYWRLENNLLFGGAALYSKGLVISTRNPDADWPAVLHNTIVAGGDAPNTDGAPAELYVDGLQSRALVLEAPSDTGLFVGNLLDAGRALGRRTLLYRGQAGTTAVASENAAQLAGAVAAAPYPSFVFLAGDANGGPVAGGSNLPFHVILRNAGSLQRLDMSAATGVEVDEQVTRGFVESATRTGNDTTIEWTLVLVLRESTGDVCGSRSLLATTRVSKPNVFMPALHTPLDSSGARRRPIDATLAFVNSDDFPDLVFVEGACSGEVGALWYLPGEEQGYGAAAPLTGFALDSPERVAVDPEGYDLAVINRVPGNDVELVVSARAAGDTASSTAVAYSLLALLGGDAAAPVDALHIVYLDADSNNDVLVASGNKVLAWYDTLESAPGVLRAPDKNITTCPSSGIATLSVAEVDNAYLFVGGKEVVVGCDDGTMRVLDSQLAPQWLYSSGPAVKLGSVAAVHVQSVPPRSVFLLAYPETNAVALLCTSPGGGCATAWGTFTAQSSITFMGDIAVRDHLGALAGDFPGGEPLALANGGIVNPVTGPWCALGFEQDAAKATSDPVVAFDTHLVGPANECRDKRSAGPADDFDAQGSRSDGAFDIGADELP